MSRAERTRDDRLAIGELAARSGLATSAVRFYEAEGLIRAERTASGRRVFRRHVLRRLAFISSAQRVGLSLRDVADALDGLPLDRAPTKAAWAQVSRRWRRDLDDRIADLERLRDDLTSCIGCGCLSLQTCRLLNTDDAAAARGTGPRYLLGDDPEEVVGHQV
jgi:MerR family transcriptional regulator, redox-sensitive transcriptional activator SoxR